MNKTSKQSIQKLLESVNWLPLEGYLDDLKPRLDESLQKSKQQREKFRQELLENNPDLITKIKSVPEEKLEWAKSLLQKGTIAACDGTISFVPLLGGSKIQIGVVIVSNSGDVVNLVTKMFETDLVENSKTAVEFFTSLREARKISNLLGRAIMLSGERKALAEHKADWKLIHGEIIPHELRTGAGNPADNLDPAFDLVRNYVEFKNFIAVSEGSDDIDILNAASILEPCEYIVIKSLTESLTQFLDGDEIHSPANFNTKDKERFRQFIHSVGDDVVVVLLKASSKPYIIECHKDKIEEAVSIFLVDSLWSRGLPLDDPSHAIRGFPFHIDLADQVARTLFKGADFRNYVESRLFELEVESGVFDLDARRTR